MAMKTYPAKARTATRKQPLPATLDVDVQRDGHLFHASARRKCATSHSGAWATRKLAELLGYSKHADVLYVCKDAASGAARFMIVEVLPC